jgi:hypothetical protein
MRRKHTMRGAHTGIWVLCETKYNDLIVILKSDFDRWEKLYTRDYKFIAEGSRSTLQAIRKVIKEST